MDGEGERVGAALRGVVGAASVGEGGRLAAAPGGSSFSPTGGFQRRNGHRLRARYPLQGWGR